MSANGKFVVNQFSVDILLILLLCVQVAASPEGERSHVQILPFSINLHVVEAIKYSLCSCFLLTVKLSLKMIVFKGDAVP